MIKDYSFDVALDFSTADAVLSNVKILAKIKKNLVIGTTNWEKHLNEVSQLLKQVILVWFIAQIFQLGCKSFSKSLNILLSFSINLMTMILCFTKFIIKEKLIVQAALHLL